MYSCEKEKQSRSRKSPKDEMPSFSSTLLDEIYRSIDGGAEKPEDFRAYREKLSAIKKQSIHNRAPTKTSNTTTPTISDDGDAARSFRRARLVEKWIEKEKNEKKPVPRKSPNPELYHNSDVMFFSSTSSSNSDSSGALSSSDTEFFGPRIKPPKVSCFNARPKPVRTSGPARRQPEDDFTLFGDFQNNEKNKSRALKLYADLKKASKQPISPGARLTSFINSLFKNNPIGKKSKKNDHLNNNNNKSQSQSHSQSACSSATSYSRSCLNKNSKTRDGTGREIRIVRFDPVVDQDSLRPRGKNGKPPLPIRDRVLADLKVEVKNDSKGYNGKMDEDEDEEDDYDGMSDSSSDLFELDHLSLFGSNRFCEELPVYETTRLDDTNHAFASRLMR